MLLFLNVLLGKIEISKLIVINECHDISEFIRTSARRISPTFGTGE